MIKVQDFEAVIFDMDGVLIDSEPLWKIAMEEAFHSVGCMITKKDFQKTVGLRIDEVVEYWHKHSGWKDLSVKEVEDLIIQKMVRLIKENGDPLVGVLDTISFLKSQGLKVGLATSSYNILIDTVLDALGIRDAFDVVNSAEDEEFGKPHPAVYLTVANKLKVDPIKCLVIEDSLNGVIAGMAAKMNVVCIPEKTHNPERKLQLAHYLFEDMALFLEHIKSNS
ncbi:hexitol phosphatase HxpB [Crocinitomicaceae bacterium]|uniref:2-deoxyglucose-6-phosphatase n=1 Tax=uncultured Flavobacteriia bacterium TaxID=212695 RepID=H6RDQ4_9BACT|nr:2-deoxyglucose-6-phosphate hydrolase YniC [uncultured bacterium]MDA9275272.1 hexitol phosphatase HxpB [Crocinitomicaceae bacterium]CCF99165.1 2-deoxyglucose-6-phosphatase [uncultured Flavobacteriia bacterium]MDC0099599.1 hexitol phosphatase HxpB [Crocinitomicaceae bacterium]MDC1283091.1 hexitol phosphatase HxpB [Crocinitomicaceae bacterium]